jgi:hypothetical protein
MIILTTDTNISMIEMMILIIEITILMIDKMVLTAKKIK